LLRGRFALVALAVSLVQPVFAEDILLSTESFSLTVGEDASVRSLKLSGLDEELVLTDVRLPFCEVEQERPFHNELKLMRTTKRTRFRANRLKVEGDVWTVGFEDVPFEAIVRVRSGRGYAVFTLEDLRCDPVRDYGVLRMDLPPVARFRLLQLPLAERTNFGDWLNVVWDERAAVAVVGMSPKEDVDHADCRGGRILFAEAVRGIRLNGGSAALVVGAGKERFLDSMDALETDYGLPRGVRSRRSGATNGSIYHADHDLTPETVDTHIDLAKRGGFRYLAIADHAIVKRDGLALLGDWDYNAAYPGGRTQLQEVLSKIRAAGLVPGLHIIATHIGLKSRYAAPSADLRLGRRCTFTLAADLPKEGEILEIRVVEQPGDDVPMHPKCRLLQFGGEFFTYDGCSSEAPFRFTGVKRAAWKTTPRAHVRGEAGGVVDLSEFGEPSSCYANPATDLPDEIAAKVAAVYSAGFGFVYFDGSEGVAPPYNYRVADAQERIWKRLFPAPLFAEGAAKSHYSWHMLSGANAFDVFPPESFKDMLRKYPFAQAEVTARDMTRVDFGWWDVRLPTETSVGTQPDMWEYGLSVGVSRGCPTCIIVPSVEKLRRHPRLDDLLETCRRWESVRVGDWLTDARRRELLRTDREHHLYADEDGALEMVTWEQIPVVGRMDSAVRAFLFERDGRRVVAYWHVSGSGMLDLGTGYGKLEAGDRRYWETDLSADTVRRLFAAARIVPCDDKAEMTR